MATPATSEMAKAVGAGFLRCPVCAEAEVRVLLDLTDATLQCGECNAEFSPDDVRAVVDDLSDQVRKWRAVLGWLEGAVAAMPRLRDK